MLDPRIAPLASVRKFYPPDKRALLGFLKKRLTSTMLDQIANCDYGHDSHWHRREINSILAAGDVTNHLDWHPGEVFALTRWSEFDADDFSSNETGEQVHLKRLFACTALMLADQIPFETGCTAIDSDTLIQWVDSATYLQRDYIKPVLCFLMWQIEHENTPNDCLSSFLAILILLAEFGNIKLISLPDYIDLLKREFERTHRCQWGGPITFNIRDVVGGIRKDKWYRYIERLTEKMENPQLSELLKKP